MTKQFVGFLLAGAVEDGLIAVDDGVRPWLPSCRSGWRRSACDISFTTGYVLLAEIVGRVRGRPLTDLIRAAIFDPLGLNATRLGGCPITLPGVPDPPGTIGDGGLWTSVADLSRWLTALNEETLDAAAGRRVETVGRLNDGSALDYAWGVRITHTPSGRQVTHGGSWGGWLAKTVRLPEKHIAVAVLSTGGTEAAISGFGTELATPPGGPRQPWSRIMDRPARQRWNTSPVTDVWDELTWRGLIALSTDGDALRAQLAAGPVTFYVGFDPTAPSLHFGNLVQLMVARALQAAGHHPLILVGGSTGLIGDPKESAERVLNPKEVVAEWVGRIHQQVERFVDFTGDNPARIVNNLDWTASFSVLDFLRDIGKHFPVNRMLARDVVRNRLEDGISYTEFSYVLLQSFDYLELFRNHGCTLQTGGSDQWGNITAGVELIRRADGARVHALATPLLTKADGTKFGKTESGTVWLDSEMTSPYAFHQAFLNVEDEKVVEYLKVFSPRDHHEITELARQTAAQPQLRTAQKALADDVTDLVHSRAEREAAVSAASALFGRASLDDLDPATLAGVVAEVGGVKLTGIGTEVTVVDLLERSGVVPSRGAARRAIAEGGAYLNNHRVTDPEAVLGTDDLLHGRYAILRRGKKTVGAVSFDLTPSGA